MIAKIFITHRKEDNITRSFWENFFGMCGIWTENIQITKTIRNSVEVKTEGTCLSIAGTDASLQVSEITNDQIAFAGENRKALEELLDGKDEQNELLELFDIYAHKALWGTVWLYQNAIFKIDSPFKEQIASTCKNIVEKPLRHDSWHTKFFQIYCEYMYKDLAFKNSIDRVDMCKGLLEQIQRLADTSGWVAPLCILAGKICRLSHIQEKNVVHYYRSIPEPDKNTDVICHLGKAYETACGQVALAMVCYREAYEKSEGKCFLAGYRLALEELNDGNWTEAYEIYVNLLQKFKETDIGGITSMHEIEYFYKTLERLIWISKNCILDGRLEEKYKKEQTDLVGNIKRAKPFTTLFSCMFGNELGELLKRQVMDEIIRLFIK